MMQLRELLSKIAANYDRRLPLTSEAQQLLRSAGKEMQQWLPAGYIADGSGGLGRPAICPWIAVFDPDETQTARRGMYLVYIFAADMTSVTLTLLLGGEELRDEHGDAAALGMLDEQAGLIRSRLPTVEIADLETSVDLGSTARRPRLYKHGNVIARRYATAELPPEPVLIADLRRFLRLYDAALAARRQVDGAIETPDGSRASSQRGVEFKPKDDSDYRQLIAAREIIKTRRHETLVHEYGLFLRDRGFVVATPHPVDLTAEAGERLWLVEAKTVRAGDGEPAAREALSQLMFYSHFLYSDQDVGKVALFSEEIGIAYVDFFEQLGIASVWRASVGWEGSPSAQRATLC